MTPRSTIRSPFVLAVATTALLLPVLPAQNGHAYLPATQNPAATELPDYHLRPFMQPNARVQMFFSAAEAGGSAFTIDELALRYDGPIPQVGAPGPFAIQRLEIRVGATAVPQPGAVFAQNLTAPLTTVFDGPWSYLPDPGMQIPHPWGGPGDALRFPFTTPASVTIPNGGWLVIELAMHQNQQLGYAHAILDGIRTGGGIQNGSAANSGQGCPVAPAQPAMTIASTGSYAPGAAHFLRGSNLGSNALVFALVGFSDQHSPFGPLPFALPGTGCSFYTSFDHHWLLFADAAGAIPAGTAAAALPVPPSAAFAGMVLHEQLLAYAPGANALDFALSDLHTVTLGSIAAPQLGVYTVSHGGSADATIGDRVEPFGYAVRLRLR